MLYFSKIITEDVDSMLEGCRQFLTVRKISKELSTVLFKDVDSLLTDFSVFGFSYFGFDAMRLLRYKTN